MSGQIDDGGSAFPLCVPDYHDDRPHLQNGMSLRDWFAGQERIDQAEEFGWELLEALAGPRPSGDWKRNAMEWFDWSNRWQAAVRYARADAMIAARKGGAK